MLATVAVVIGQIENHFTRPVLKDLTKTGGDWREFGTVQNSSLCAVPELKYFINP